MTGLIIGDIHAGATLGLSTPEYWSEPGTEIGQAQRALARWFCETIESVGPVDFVVINGDAVEGRNHKGGGSGLLTIDRLEQCKIAAHYIKKAIYKKLYIVKGTKYHVGKEESWEDVLAEMLGATVHSRLFLKHEGRVLACRHKLDRSGVPHGRATPLLRAKLWNELNAARETEERADLMVFSHVHYYSFAGDSRGAAVTCPALQIWTDYGETECEGSIDVGMLKIEISEGGITWEPLLMPLETVAHPVVEL